MKMKSLPLKMGIIRYLKLINSVQMQFDIRLKFHCVSCIHRHKLRTKQRQPRLLRPEISPLLFVEQNTHTAVQECVTKAGLLVLDGVWYSAVTRSQCSPQQWDKWSRRAAAQAPPRARQEVARRRTQNTVGNEPEALTFSLLDSKPTWPTGALGSAECMFLLR